MKAALQALRILHAACRDHDTSVRGTLDLITCAVAVRRGLFSKNDDPLSALFDPFLTASEQAALPWEDAWNVLQNLPDEQCTSQLPGDLYPLLRETTFDAGGTADVRGNRGHRRHHGAFYTPPALVHTALDMVASAIGNDARICDPAMGTGNFLLGAIHAMPRSADLSVKREFAQHHLFGIDHDPLAVRLTRRALWLTLSAPGDPFVTPTDTLVCADTLLHPDPLSFFPNAQVRGGFDAIIGNPPYDVLTNFARYPERKSLAQRIRASGFYTDALKGQINLYRCFIERSLHLLRSGGYLSFVVPASLQTDAWAAPLRAALLQKHGADRFVLYPESMRVFETVTQAVTIFRARRNAGATKQVTLVRADEAVETQVPIANVRRLSNDLPLPHATAADWALVSWLSENTTRCFSDIADGFVGEVDQTLYRRHMKDEPTDTVLVRGSHVQPFAVDMSEAAHRHRWLDRNGFLAQKGTAAKTCRERVSRERVAQLGIRNMATRPRLVAARVPPHVYLGNSVNFWVPRDGIPLELVLGLLNSRLYEWRFSLCSGNNNINLREIVGLPLPAEWSARAVDHIVQSVEDCEKPVPQGALKTECRTTLDDAVESLFQLPAKYRLHLDRVIAHTYRS